MSDETLSPQDIAKRAAGAAAIDRYVTSGMKLGLGSGSTSHWMVKTLGERVRAGLDVVGVPTSTGTAEVARAAGVPLADLNDLGELDLTFDGADEIDRQLRMIKGGGACLLWEKIVATASKRMVALVDDKKVVDGLGAFPLPVEVIRFGWTATQRLIERLLAEHGLEQAEVVIRGGPATPLLTDSGNVILDCRLTTIADPDGLTVGLNSIPGVVENGLFCGIADAALIGYPDGTARELTSS